MWNISAGLPEKLVFCDGQTAGSGWTLYVSPTEIVVKPNIIAGGTLEAIDATGLQTSVCRSGPKNAYSWALS